MPLKVGCGGRICFVQIRMGAVMGGVFLMLKMFCHSWLRFVFLVLIAIFLKGCGTTLPSFEEGLSAPDKNMSFDIQIVEGPILSMSLNGELHIYELPPGTCQLKHRGAVKFKGGKVPVAFGLQPGLHYFRIVQREYSFLYDSYNRQAVDFKLDVLPGKTYAISYIVKNKLAGKKVMETDKASGASKEVFGEPWRLCAG